MLFMAVHREVLEDNAPYRQDHASLSSCFQLPQRRSAVDDRSTKLPFRNSPVEERTVLRRLEFGRENILSRSAETNPKTNKMSLIQS